MNRMQNACLLAILSMLLLFVRTTDAIWNDASSSPTVFHHPAFVGAGSRSHPSISLAERKRIKRILHQDTARRCYQNNEPPTILYLDRLHGTNSTRHYSSTELSASFADVTSLGYKIYCDLDGVLVDFEKGVQNLLKIPSYRLVKGTMWKHIARAEAFYEHLDWTQDGRRLWEEIKHLRPNILTGVPYPKSSRVEKYNWCKRELGLDNLHHVDMASGCRDHDSVNGNLPRQDATNLITCWSNNKHYECDDRSVLIDDRECAREPWETRGGIFIHHVNAESTLKQLRERGIL